MTVQNKELIRRFVEDVYNKQDLDTYLDFVDEGIAEDGADHLQQFFTAFPDAHTTVLDMFGEGDKVVARLRIKAINKGPFRWPASNRERGPVRLYLNLPHR